MGKIGQSDTTSRKFFQHADRHRRFLPSLLNVQNRAFGKSISKIFCWCTVPSIVFRGYYPHTGSSPFLCPSISTWRKSAIVETPEEIFCRGRNSRCTFSQTPLTPTWEKSGKLTPPPEKFFQHVSHHLMSKNELFGNLFRIVISNCSARVSIVIDHPCEFCQHHLLSAGPYCPLSLYVKIEAEWKHFLKIFW